MGLGTSLSIEWNHSKIQAKRVASWSAEPVPFGTFEPAKSKDGWGWQGLAAPLGPSIEWNHIVPVGTQPKRQNPSKIQAKRVAIWSAEPVPCGTFEPAKSKDGWGCEGLAAPLGTSPSIEWNHSTGEHATQTAEPSKIQAKRVPFDRQSRCRIWQICMEALHGHSQYDWFGPADVQWWFTSNREIGRIDVHAPDRRDAFVGHGSKHGCQEGAREAMHGWTDSIDKAIAGQKTTKHARAGPRCGAGRGASWQEVDASRFPCASPSGKAEGSADKYLKDINLYGCWTHLNIAVPSWIPVPWCGGRLLPLIGLPRGNDLRLVPEATTVRFPGAVRALWSWAPMSIHCGHCCDSHPKMKLMLMIFQV